MNLVKKAYKFRLYPTTKQVECFQWMLERCRELYNAALEERRYAYQRIKRDAGSYDQRRVKPSHARMLPRSPSNLNSSQDSKRKGQNIRKSILKSCKMCCAAWMRHSTVFLSG